MTEHRGVPHSERAELAGLQYQSAHARDELQAAVSSLSSAAAHRPTMAQLAQRGAARAGRRAISDARHAVPPKARALLTQPVPPGRARSVVAAALVVLAAVAAVVVVARLRRSR